MTKRPFLILGIASFSAALLCSITTLRGVAIVMIAALFCLWVSLSLFRGQWRKLLALTAAGVLLVSTGFFIKVLTVVYPQFDYAEQTVKLTMRVCDKLTADNAYEVQVEGGELDGIHLCLWLGNSELAPKNGDLLSGEVELNMTYDREQFGKATFAKAGGLYLHAWATEYGGLLWEDGQDSVPLAQKPVYTLREAIHNTLYRHLSFEAAALCESVLLGIRTNLSSETAWAFRATGVYHLLAVSGMHLTVLTGVVLWLFKAVRCGRIAQGLLTMGAVVLFMALCGFTASVVRAGVMTLLMLSGMWFRRRADGLNSLGLAAFVMLLCDPFCILDIGWQLSFAATLGLLTLFPVWEKEITAKAATAVPQATFVLSPLLSAIGVTVCATLMTQPLTALYFGELSAVFIPTNLLCSAPSSLLLIVCFAALLTGWLPPLQEALLDAANSLCTWLEASTGALAELPFSYVSVREPFYVLWLFVLLAAVIVGYRVCKMRGVLRVSAVMSAMLLVGVTVLSILSRGTIAVTAVTTDSVVMTVCTDDSDGLIFSGDGDALEDAVAALRAGGVRTLDWVLWLDAPTAQAIDTSSFTMPITRLLTAGAAEDYAVLPFASHTATLDEQDSVTLSAACLVERRGNGYCLLIGETAVWIATDAQSLALLKQEYASADLLCVKAKSIDATAIEDIETTVVYGSYSRCEAAQLLLGDCAGAVYYSAFEDELTFLTRGSHDIILQLYGFYDIL